MRVFLATLVALLALNFVDEHLTAGYFTRALAQMMAQIRQSIGM